MKYNGCSEGIPNDFGNKLGELGITMHFHENGVAYEFSLELPEELRKDICDAFNQIICNYGKRFKEEDNCICS